MKILYMILVTLFSVSIGLMIVSFLYILQIIPSNILYQKFRDNKEIKQLVLEAAKFYHKELGISGDPNIKIQMPWSPSLFWDVHGYIDKKPGVEEYDMVIYMNHNKYSILETVAHEMIHISQYNRGDLVRCGLRNIWQGQDYTKTNYWKRPWEIEAFGNEKAMAQRFYESKGIKKPLTLKGVDWLASKLID